MDYAQRVLWHDLQALKSSHLHNHPDDPAILHRKEIEGARHHYRRLRGEGRKEAFYDELSDFLTSHNYRAIVSGLDKFKHFKVYEMWPEDPYHICLTNMLERYFLFLQARQAEGDVFIEGRDPKKDGKLQQVYSDFYQQGSKGGRFNISAEDIQSRFTSRKLNVRQKVHNIAGLQVADAIALTLHNYCVGTYGAHDLVSPFDARVLPWLLGRALLRDAKKSRLEGWGIVWRPDYKRNERP